MHDEEAEAREDDWAERLIEEHYEKIRSIARQFMKRERRDHTLTATDLVSEAYFKVESNSSTGDVSSKAPEKGEHFILVMVNAMRQRLVDHARKRLSQKGGGCLSRVHNADLEEILGSEAASLEEHLDLNDALDRLGKTEPHLAAFVKLRYFAGLSLEEVARIMGVTTRTCTRWKNAAIERLRADLDR